MQRLNLLPPWAVLLAVLLISASATRSDTPDAISFQGRVSVEGVPFTGTGSFRFALVVGESPSPLLHLDPPAGPPLGAIPLPVSKGLFSVRFGVDTIPVPLQLLTQTVDLRLRVWFSDGFHSEQQLTPDQPLASVPYAHRSFSAATANTATSATIATTAASVSGPVPMAQITGTLPDSQLPNTVARLNSSPTFTGNITANTFLGAGALPWTRTSSASEQAQPNRGYIATRADTPVTFTFPATAQVGDVIWIDGEGSGGWEVRDANGLSVLIGAPGTTWTELTTLGLPKSWRSAACSADGRKLVACAFNDTLFTSINSGTNWSSHGPSTNWTSVASSSDGTKLVACANPGRVYTSIDSGQTWASRDTKNPSWTSIASSADGTRLIGGATSSYLLVSLDSGLTWNTSGSFKNWTSVASSADGTRWIACASTAPLLISRNSGATWTERATARQWTSVSSSADGSRLAACVDGGNIHISVDGGVNWTARAPSAAWNSVASSADGRSLVASVRDGRIYTSSDFGVTWAARGPVGPWTAVAMSTDARILLAGAEIGDLHISRARTLRDRHESTEFRCSDPGVWTSTSRVTLDDTGLIPVREIPALSTSQITSGVFDSSTIPGTLLGRRNFLDSVGVGSTSSAGRLNIASQEANDDFGYCISLNNEFDNPRWLLGVSYVGGRFSLGAAGLRDHDISVSYSSGNVGIGGTGHGNMKLTVYGDLKVEGTGYADNGFYLSSDSRAKTSIASLPDSLGKVSQLRGVSFEWLVTEQKTNRPAGRQLGLLAQEVVTVLPELVHTNIDGFLSVNYDGIIPVLVEAMKDQNRIFESRLAEKDAQLHSLADRIQALEARQPSRPTEPSSTPPSTAPRTLAP